MDKFAVDYSYIDQKLNSQKSYKYEEVKNRLVKVAYDIVRFMDADESIDGLWQIQKTDDGEVIVAMYDDTVKTASKKTESDWHVFPDRANTSINIFYKNEPIKRIASEMIEDSNFLPSLCKDIEVKLASDDSFRNKLLNELSLDQKSDLLTRFPEITR